MSNKEEINFNKNINNENNIIFDPQTSGGLLAAVDRKKSKKVISELKENNCYAAIIGEVIEKEEFELN